MADIIDIRRKLKRLREEREEFGPESNWETGVDLLLEQQDREIDLILEQQNSLAEHLIDLQRDVEDLKAILTGLIRAKL